MSQNILKPLSRKTNIVIQEFKNEILIYDLTNNKAFSLNETSALVWQSCDGNRDIREIADEISRKLKKPVSEDLVRLALAQLDKDNLVVRANTTFADFRNLSRREVIRKIGLASLVTLPAIISLTAPTAAHAQSAVACSTAAPGGVQCRCDCATIPNGSTCGAGLAVDPCNAGCTCTRTAIGCYGGANPAFFGTALGTCS